MNILGLISQLIGIKTLRLTEYIERGRVEYMELENKRLYIKEEKIHLAKWKEERERIKEEETIRLAIMKGERERQKEERKRMKEEREIMTINVDAFL